jgi:hypothetical protein
MALRTEGPNCVCALTAHHGAIVAIGPLDESGGEFVARERISLGQSASERTTNSPPAPPPTASESPPCRTAPDISKIFDSPWLTKTVFVGLSRKHRAKVATPTGSAQCETTRNLLRAATSEAVAECLTNVHLVA